VSDLLGKVDKKARKPWIRKWSIKRLNEGNEKCKQRGRQEALQTIEGLVDKSHRQDQEGVSWEQMWRDHGISKSRTLRFDVHEDEGTGLERQLWNSRHWH
jgi:hypothetical protein